MQVARTLQKAWRNLGSNRTNILHSGLIRSVAGASDFYWLILLSRSPTKRPLQLPKRSSRRRASLLHHYCDPGALSGAVKGLSLESTTKTASKLAVSFSLAFSLIP
jgi:hypothetical protein